MCECKNSDEVGQFEIHDVERESPYRHATDPQFWWKVWNCSPSVGKMGDELQSGIDGFKELTPKAAPLLLVPESRYTEFGRGFGFGPKPRCHCSVRRRAIRSRTSSQGSPADSSARTRRARRSNSFAQAACTTAGSSAGGSSRLANSSAATSARSSGGRVSASRSKACARLVMDLF
jgi:hypothetical protein